MQPAYWILMLPPLFWSGNFIIGRALGDLASPISLSYWRWFLASLILLPWVIKPVWQQRQVIKQHFFPLLVLSFTGVSAFNTFAYIGLQYTTATNGTLLNSLIPIFIIVISLLFFHTKSNSQQIIGIVLSFTGVLIILTQLSLEQLMSLSFNQGDLWILVAAIDWAIYSVLLKQYRPQSLDNLTFLGITIIMGWLLLIPLYLINPFNEPTFPLSLENALALAYIAVFPSIIAYFAWNYGIAKVGANIGGQFIHLMPLFGAILAMFFLGESLHLFHFLGAALIAWGLVLSLNLKKTNK